MKFRVLTIFTALFVCGQVALAPAATNFVSLTYAPAPANNPLKGFIPYSGSFSTFPYSMEWQYLSLRSLMTGPTNFNWTALDNLLNGVASRGHQTAFRIYLDFPTKTTGIPQYLLDGGLATHSYSDYGNSTSLSPNYEDPNLRQALTNFIAAFGARYDGDPRIGFITVGLLGFWGEWHTWPSPGWFASTAVQNQVLSAYQAAFPKTKLLVRYATGTTAPYAIGFHDDSFAYSTLPPASGSFYGDIQNVGQTSKWQTQPIGGEVRPEVQSCLWDGSSSCTPSGQAFSNCVTTTHASWMLNQRAFDPGFSGAQKTAAVAGAQSMGYELYVTNATLADAGVSGPLNMNLLIRNTRVAPFYYNWPVQLRVLNSSQQTVQTWTTSWQLASLLPGANQTWNFTRTNHGLALGQYKLLVGVPNPMANGLPLRFANQTQDADLQGWLTLGTFSVGTNSVSTNDPPPATNNFTVTVDPTKTWTAGLNYYSTDGSYLGYQNYTLAQNPATFVPSQTNATRLLLGINTNTYAPGSAWNAADGTPLRHLETDTYVDAGMTYSGNTVIFTGTVESNSLPAGWIAYAFIKEYTAGYATFLPIVTTILQPSGTFSVQREVAVGNGIQYGFYVYGPNTAPGSPNAQQRVSILVGNSPTINSMKITASVTGATVRVSFPTQSGVTHTVQYKNQLTNTSWQTLTTLTGTGAVAAPTDTLAGAVTTKFYRVMSQP